MRNPTVARSTPAAARPHAPRLGVDPVAVNLRAGGALDLHAGGGAPVPDSLRAELEPRFGFEFRSIRIHTDARADASARALGAEAFTLGHDIHFAAGRFRPESDEGRRLVVHEITHVAQQRLAAPSRLLGRSGDASEREADRAAATVRARREPGSLAPRVAATAVLNRQPAPGGQAVAGLGLLLGADDVDPRVALTSADYVDNDIDEVRLVETWSGLSVRFPAMVIHYRDGSAMYVPIQPRFLRSRKRAGEMQIVRYRRDGTTGKIFPAAWRGRPEQLPAGALPEGEVFFAEDLTPNVMAHYDNAIVRRAFSAAGDLGALWSIGLVATSSIQIFMSVRALAMARAAAGAAGLAARQSARLAEQRAMTEAERRATSEAQRRGLGDAERQVLVRSERQAALRGAEWMGGFTHGIREGEITAINRTFGGTTMMTGHPASAIAAASRQTGFWNKVAAMVREIAGRHMFDNGNKRTAQAVLELLKQRNNVATGVSASETRRIIDQVARGELTDVAAIAEALRGF